MEGRDRCILSVLKRCSSNLSARVKHWESEKFKPSNQVDHLHRHGCGHSAVAALDVPSVSVITHSVYPETVNHRKQSTAIVQFASFFLFFSLIFFFSYDECWRSQTIQVSALLGLPFIPCFSFKPW